MQSKAVDVTAYLEEIPSERKATLIRLRELCQRCLTGYEEKIAYGMPCYALNDVVEVAFASQKNYIALYILKQAVLDAHRDELIGASCGKGCIRYRNPEKIDFAVVEKLLTGTRNSTALVC